MLFTFKRINATFCNAISVQFHNNLSIESILEKSDLILSNVKLSRLFVFTVTHNRMTVFCLDCSDDDGFLSNTNNAGEFTRVSYAGVFGCLFDAELSKARFV